MSITVSFSYTTLAIPSSNYHTKAFARHTMSAFTTESVICFHTAFCNISHICLAMHAPAITALYSWLTVNSSHGELVTCDEFTVQFIEPVNSSHVTSDEFTVSPLRQKVQSLTMAQPASCKLQMFKVKCQRSRLWGQSSRSQCNVTYQQ